MTIIVWDGKTLAADSQFVQEGLTGTTSKLFVIHHPRLGKIMVGFCGSTRGSATLLDLLCEDRVETVLGYDPESIYGLGIDSRGNQLDIYGDGRVIAEHRANNKSALGSAWQFASGALYAGHDAEFCVALCIEHRSDAGGHVDVLRFEEVFHDA